MFHFKNIFVYFHHSIFNMKYCLAIVVALSCLLPATLSAQNNKPTAVINHLAIYVVDLQRSGEFYENIIGLDTIPEPFHDGKHIWLSIGPKASLHIIQGAQAPINHFKNNHICFSLPSVESFIELLKKNGIGFEDVSGNKNIFSTRPDGVKQLWMQDPDGYWIEINDAKQ